MTLAFSSSAVTPPLAKVAIRRAVLASTMALPLLISGREALAFSAPLCPGLTCSGGTPTLTSGPGGLSHPEIAPIFWGSYWNNPTSVTRAQTLGVLQAVVNSAYFGALSQYGSPTIGPMRMAPMAPIFTGSEPAAVCGSTGAPCTFDASGNTCGLPITDCRPTQTSFETTINAAIGLGLVPPPVPGTDMLYLVFVAPDKAQNDWNSPPVSCDATCGPLYSGATYQFAFVQGGDWGGMTHEMVEAITYNVVVSGCSKPGGGSVDQIADICGCAGYGEDQFANTDNPFGAAAYWSNADQQCVVPEGWSQLSQFSGGTWTQIYSGALRQVYAGGYGLIGTDDNDNLLLYSGTPGVWTQIGGPGAAFAVGNSSVFGVAPDGTSVSQYSGSGWTEVLSQPVTSVMAGGNPAQPDVVITTDVFGNPLRYSGSPNAWQSVGLPLPTDQLAVNATGLFSVAADRHVVSFSASARGGDWVDLGDVGGGVGIQQLIAGPSGVAATDLVSGDLWSFNGVAAGTKWTLLGGPGNMFVEATGLYGLTPQRSAIDEYTPGANPSSTQIHGPAAFLVGNGPNALYAATGVQYAPQSQPAPGCVPTSTCSNEYTPAGFGTPVGASVIETINVSCTSQPSTAQQFEVEQQMVNGAWVNLGIYYSNLGYTQNPPPQPAVFDTVNQPAGTVVKIRACSLDAAGIDAVCDSATPVTVQNCCITTCAPGTCGTSPNQCGGTIDCGPCGGDSGPQTECEAEGGTWVDGKCIIVKPPKCGNLPC